MSRAGQVALVTGGNKGIGFEICRRLGELGVTVLVGARSRNRGVEAAERLVLEGASAEWVPLDVVDAVSVERAATAIEDRFGKLDILVNNAGIFLPEPTPGALDAGTMKAVYETNVFGVQRVTSAMLPLLRRSPAGRIVNMSSSLGSLGLHGDPSFELGGFLASAYNSSKTAVNAMTVMLAKELAGTPIKVNAADPGYCATDMNGRSGPRTPAQGARAAVRLAMLPADGPTGRLFDEKGPLPW
ncbi:SDR family oxidoreductase [Paenibacillus antri]|uniref:SDR family oxidoreductase n=1 Tax=Paenibacillus antri TaxID=2582848 RepID=A0A5R9G848_9BACL|nr:SDR family oxidoreductase [Paenibacillus antri]TLS52597.1 SDR family oxidoreductase [Paenibacillus antri]